MSVNTVINQILLASLALVLVGCSRTYYSDVPEPKPPSATSASAQIASKGSATYTVANGDSLYKISFVTGQDWREIARLNGIKAPYVIYPGQVLILRPVTASTPSPRSTSKSTAVATPRAAPSSPPLTATQSKPAQKPASKPAAPRPAKAGAWVWPASGKMFHAFSAGAQPHKGIDLSGQRGDPVYAANNGTVVYAGNSVRGYGNMLIIKHNATYLSAYAHNSRLLVGEGQAVKAGQQIAEIGDSGTDRLKLHFEVRKNGQPVDPLSVLPRR